MDTTNFNTTANNDPSLALLIIVVWIAISVYVIVIKYPILKRPNQFQILRIGWGDMEFDSTTHFNAGCFFAIACLMLLIMLGGLIYLVIHN